MIKIDIIQAKISWVYPEDFKRTTVCVLESYDGAIIARADVTASHKDKYNKETGRRKSLKKLLLKVFPGENHYQFRAAIWEKYRTLTKIPRWKTK